MDQWEEWFREKQVARTIDALRRNKFEAFYVSNSKEAFQEVMKRIPEGATVATGGSVTLAQMGFQEAFKNRKIQLISPIAQARSPEEMLGLIQKSFSADFFLTSTNAVTEDGKLFNVDATGNRVSAMIVGPKKVIVVCGVNKIVKDVADAEERLRQWTAPQNAKRLNKNTPCTETGECSDCASPDRICNIYVTLAKKPARTEIVVILVGEKLGI